MENEGRLGATTPGAGTEDLRASPSYARSLIEASLDPLVTIDRDGRITDVNRATEEATGVSRDKLIGSDFSDYFTEPEQARQGYQQVWRDGAVVDYPLAIRHASGRVIDVLYNASLYRDESGQVRGIFAAARDITERKRAEEKIRTASLYARSLIEASLDPLVTIDRDGRITDVNRATEEATGVSRDRLIGSDFSDYFTEPEQARHGYQQVWRDGAVVDYPLAIRHASGRVIDVLYNASLYRDESGQVRGIFAAARDITERKRAEEKIRTASLYARSLIEASLDPLVTIDRDGRITDVNRTTEEATGVSRDKLIGSDFSDYFTEPEQARKGYQQVWRDGAVVDYPLAIRHASGRVIDVLYNASLYRDESGQVRGIFAAARDITERKRAEEELTRFKHVLDNTLDMILMFDPDDLRFTYVNRGVIRSLGYDAETLLGMAVYDIKPRLPAQAYRALVAPLLSGSQQSVNFETEHRRADGSTYPVEVFVQFVHGESGGKGQFVSVVRDVSERKQAEEQLLRAHAELEMRVQERTQQLATANAALQSDIAARKEAEEALRRLNETLEQRVANEVAKNREKDMVLIQQSRLAAMGEMIGNIAHQWRQPLNALGLVLTNIKDAYEFHELTESYLDQTIGHGERLIQKMSTTINDFRNFFLPDKELKAFSAVEQIHEALSLVEASFRNNNIAISLTADQDLLLLGFPNEYSQVLLNVLGNAKDAIGASGQAHGQVHITLSRSGDEACVAVRDNGGGIRDDILDKIFEPYFSTKKMGTGIGLYMSKMIIERNMNGSVSVRNVEGGAEFYIRIPLADGTPPPEKNHA
ncbi:MAG: PAS domain S-box protein [Zoogloea sp.]|nr:PAS domain S-box protein [Zoogloea sp.]